MHVTAKLTPRQIAQLAWLDTLPPKLDRMKRVIELLAVHQADDTQLRSLGRTLEELKAQASGINITPLAEGFGYMAMLLRRSGGHLTRVQGLRELLAGVKINFEGAYREASTPASPATPDDTGNAVSP